ncbi:MAG: putative membrane protein [Cellvibrionaceae bacterium]|jgi:uncharacterized membrane protein
MNNNNYKKMWVVSGVVVSAMLIISFWGWLQIPAGTQVPVHFGIDGQPDRYGNPFWGMFTLPLTAIFVALILSLVPKFEPRQENFQMSGRAYRATWITLLVFFLALHVILVMATLGIGQANLLGTLLPTGLGALFVVLGNYMGKVRSNYMFGIRTPWTLASELSWNKTHRLGGRLMMAVGVTTIFANFLLPLEWTVGILIAGLVLMLIVTMVYSWMVYKDDPNVIKA